jgi:GTP-binding protein YchF
MEHIGLVGLPNAGKSALFNALTGSNAAVAPHPFTTTETSMGIAHVPDARLDALAKMSESRKVVYAGVEVVDIAGLVAGADKGEGLGNRFLGGIRTVDALCLVLRAFHDSSIAGEDDPVSALVTLELELVLADLSSVEAQLTKTRKVARVNADAGVASEALEAASRALGSGVPIYRSKLSEDDRAALGPVFLLTNKPFFVVVNIGEDDIGREDEVMKRISGELGADALVLGVCVQLEAEASSLESKERVELLEGLGLGEGALARVARAAFNSIGRQTFFTTGDKESRAWVYRIGAKAPECAGVIHSDLQRGFIRAEVIDFAELLGLGSWASAKAAGKIRLEGKDYVVRDGDVMEIRFNV